MDKLSKSDLPDQKHDDFWAWLARRPVSDHFALDSYVVVPTLFGRRERAKVVSRPGNGFMLVQFEDGTIGGYRPLGLQWERE